MDIVNTLIGMSDEIRKFSSNVEQKLESAHRSQAKFDKKGNSKKNTNIDEILESHGYFDNASASN